MKFFDMFAGIGGFRVGMEACGHECVGSCEIDEHARKVYAKNFGHEPEFRDAREIEPEKLKDFDVLCGGFPCQSFSLAGKRGGFEDTRGTLYFELIRIAKVKKPSILLFENVTGLLSHDEGQTFEIILKAMDELGYRYEWQCINSKWFVPQNRERIFLIGHLGTRGGSKILPLGDSSGWYDPTRSESGGSGEGTQGKRDRSSTLTQTYYKGWGGGRTVIAEPETNKIGSVNKGQSGNVMDTDGISSTIMAGGGGRGGKTGLYAEPKIKRADGQPNVYKTDAQAGKVYKTDGVSPTVTGQRVNSQGFIQEPKLKVIGQQTDHNATKVYDKGGIAPTVMPDGGGASKIKVSLQKCGDYDAGTYSTSDIAHCICSNPKSDYQNKIVEYFDEPELKQIGELDEKNSQAARVYDTSGTSSSLNAEGGGWGAKTGLYYIGAVVGEGGSKRKKDSDTKSRNFRDGQRVYDEKGTAATLTAGGKGSDGGATGLYAIGSTQKNAGIMKEQSPALTQAMGTGGGHVPMVTKDGDPKDPKKNPLGDFGDGFKIRRLTPKECERLQGFPDDWTLCEGVSETQRYRQLGNAVTTKVVEYIASHLKLGDGEK